MSETQGTDRPSVAGIYDCLLGGTANTAADRAVVDRLKVNIPEIAEAAWANRGFLQRAVTRMAGEWGIDQFLDLGAGLPTQRHTHEVVREQRPDGRVIYVDSDPRVIERGNALLAGTPGACAIHADVREPGRVLDDPATKALLDLSRPVGILMVAVTQFVPDEDDPWGLVRRYLDAVPSGSYLAISAPTGDLQSDRLTNFIRDSYARTSTPATARTFAAFSRFLEGLEIVPPYPGEEPKPVHVGLWGAEDPDVADDDGSRWFYAAVARKP
jgi:hypothetical protein